MCFNPSFEYSLCHGQPIIRTLVKKNAITSEFNDFGCKIEPLTYLVTYLNAEQDSSREKDAIWLSSYSPLLMRSRSTPFCDDVGMLCSSLSMLNLYEFVELFCIILVLCHIFYWRDKQRVITFISQRPWLLWEPSSITHVHVFYIAIG